MSSHQCYLKGQLILRDGVTEEQVKRVFEDFTTWIGAGFGELMEANAIEFSVDRTLLLDLPFWCRGGYRQDEVDELVMGLGKVCEGDDWLEQHDLDTGDSEAALIPYFVGETPEMRLAARRNYGLLQAQAWLEPILGKEAFASIKDYVGSFPMHEAPSVS